MAVEVDTNEVEGVVAGKTGLEADFVKSVGTVVDGSRISTVSNS